jgi:O-antigen/teichoic acid export membrane protein
MEVRRRQKSVKVNAVLNVIKQLFSVIFPMITFPYATRILGATNYGKYTFSVSIVNYISYIAAAGILRYAVRECARIRDDKKRLNSLVNEIYTINITTTVIAYVILFGLIAFVPMLKEYSLWIMIISLSVIFTTLGTDWVNSAFEDYLYITVRYIFSQAMAVLLLFILVRDNDDIAQYAFVSVFGGILANILNIVHIRKKLGIFPKLSYSRELIKHIKPILYLFACTIATFIYINSDVTMLRIFADDTSVGYYGVSTQFYQLVKQLINAAFIVVIPRISNELASDESKAFGRYNKILIITILLLIPCSIGLFMIRKNLVLLFSGIEYVQAASSLAILAIALIPAMIANFYINIVMIPLKLEKQVMIATVTSAMINVVLNFALIPIYAENAAAFTTLIAEISMTVIAVLYCRNIKMVGLVKPIVSGLVGGAIIVCICWFLNHIINNPFINVVLCVVLCGISYSAVMLLFYRSEVLSMVKSVLKRSKS